MQNQKIDKNNKIVVCITAQSNSKRLIDRGADIAEACQGEFHILHVQKGDNIFNNNETLRLLQQLMVYGSERGGMVHALCDQDIASCIGAFAQAEGATTVVMGEQPTNPAGNHNSKKKKESQFQRILDHLPPDTEVIIVKKDDGTQEEQQKDRKIV